jgi:hypothetical protein
MRAIALALSAVLAVPTAATAATVTIVNANAPGVGFNDPTSVAPVGGNPGTTRGQQALNAFQHAANLWGAALDSNIEVRVFATFEPLACTATSAVLGSAGSRVGVWDFDGAEYSNAVYPIALANKLAGADFASPADPELPAGFPTDDIRARFNSDLGKPGCLQNSGWYYGLDEGHGGSEINLATVVLHEIGHGLGFAGFADPTTGAWYYGLPGIYEQFAYDLVNGDARWHMHDQERARSAISSHLVWVGPTVTANAPAILPGAPTLWVDAPAPLGGKYPVGTASFGARLASPGVTGALTVALDASNASGPSVTDACTAITNAADVAGKIALVDRGTCGFVVKAANVQAARAVGMIVADNAVGALAGMSGRDASLVIPAVRITKQLGDALKARLADVATVRIGLDPETPAGLEEGYVKLYSPNPVEPGSSVSHFDVSTFPNQLMEPAINADLPLAVDVPYDLTRSQLRDIGWFPDGNLDGVADDFVDQCPASDFRLSVWLGEGDSTIANSYDAATGCTFSDELSRLCPGPTNHGGYVTCMIDVADAMLHDGSITVAQHGLLKAAAARNLE